MSYHLYMIYHFLQGPLAGNGRSISCKWALVIDRQSVGKRSLHLMATVNVKTRWTTIYWRVNEFLKESHIVTRLAKERASFLKINDIHFLERLTVIIVVL
jgi:hypothetical protein